MEVAIFWKRKKSPSSSASTACTVVAAVLGILRQRAHATLAEIINRRASCLCQRIARAAVARELHIDDAHVAQLIEQRLQEQLRGRQVFLYSILSTE